MEVVWRDMEPRKTHVMVLKFSQAKNMVDKGLNSQ